MKTYDIAEYLGGIDYPGRGVLLGRDKSDTRAVAAYFIMGRSENSRNRVFERTEDGIRTRAYDESKMTDPSLIIYHPVRAYEGKTIVTNGDQTDTIRDFLAQGHCYRKALLSREFEPDAPNYTPRISGVIKPDGSCALSILKSLDGDPDCCCRYFYEYDRPLPGVGYLIHTYERDGNPLPSFEGEPRLVRLDCGGAAELARRIWDSLNEDNKVSLFVRYIDLRTGAEETEIINKFE